MTANVPPFSVFWFRRDLRLNDNHGFYQALKSGLPVLPIFIFDRNILDKLSNRRDKRVKFIHDALSGMHQELASFGSGIRFYYGRPEEVFTMLMEKGGVKAVFTNEDYEPYARERDGTIAAMLQKAGIPFHLLKDQVVFEKMEVKSGQGNAYTVFTPYSRQWKAILKEQPLVHYPSEKALDALVKWSPKPIIPLNEMGFEEPEDYPSAPPKETSDKLLKEYGEKRDFPALPATSRLSVHLRFGTVSIRALVAKGLALSEPWLNELIWRDFYMNIVWNFPHIGEGKSFKPAYDRIPWRNNEAEFKRWCEGTTGYGIVDAGMRELNATGFMHNRVRMITASFLVKHLLIDWRWGEAYFAEKLLDFDFAANNGGWQWAAGSGCDAAPYFRVFNPLLQTEKFDKNREYIKKWVPEYNQVDYLQNPVVNHEFARKRVLDVYKSAMSLELPVS